MPVHVPERNVDMVRVYQTTNVISRLESRLDGLLQGIVRGMISQECAGPRNKVRSDAGPSPNRQQPNKP